MSDETPAVEGAAPESGAPAEAEASGGASFAAAVEAFARAVVSGDSVPADQPGRPGTAPAAPADQPALSRTPDEPVQRPPGHAAAAPSPASGTPDPAPGADDPAPGADDAGLLPPTAPLPENHVDDAPRPLGVARVGSGDARVDGLLGRLGDLDELPVAEHQGVYEETHDGLRAVLAALDVAQGPPPPSAR
ncbi:MULTISPECIES: hypothetical protein [unclassified Streptomyces]|uniref:hypothetical protein n=1 Tax=unclassified Streptomyces TaxID=2593676 RepID=UPI00081DADA7|nr:MULTISPECIES: hypothetical protein [unclassified Streptomyces]SCF16349.1 hypothetical protein GA0115257_10785 [Streptomyces sp. LcepLS]